MSEEILKKLDRENLTIAPISKRATSYIIDEVILSILFTVIYWNDFMINSGNFEQMLAEISQLTINFILLKLLYQTFFIWYYGATIGKIICKTICIDYTLLDKPNFKMSLLRAFVRIFSESLFYLGFAWAFGNILKQTWHDKIAKTVVINVY